MNRPIGALLRVEINATTLSDIAATSAKPEISRMSSAWMKENCYRVEASILAINCLDETTLFLSGGNVYEDTPVEVDLPITIGATQTRTLYLCKEHRYITLQFDNAVLLAFPVANLVALLLGCLLYTSPSPRDLSTSRMPSSA